MWNEPILPLTLKSPTKHKKISSSKWNSMKKEIYIKYNNICCFCGGKYKNTFCIIYIYPKTASCCKLCFNIQNLTNNNIQDFELINSNLKQYIIVQRFVDYYKKYNMSPSILDIDKNAKSVDLSLIEYLRSPFKTKLKLFPNEYFCTDYLDDIKDINMFIDDDDNECFSDELLIDMNKQDNVDYYIKLQKNNPCKNLKKTKLKNNEIKYLEKIFKNTNVNNFNKEIENIIYDYTMSQINIYDINIKYEYIKELIPLTL